MIRIVVAGIAGLTVMGSSRDALAVEEYLKPISSQETSIAVCAPKEGDEPDRKCDAAELRKLADELDGLLAEVLSRAQPQTVPLLKRDQVWARELVGASGDVIDAEAVSAEDVPPPMRRLSMRIGDVRGIKDGLGRLGVAGRWVNAFGEIEIAAENNGTRLLRVRTESLYGASDEPLHSCVASASLAPASNGWLAGDVTLAASAEGEAIAVVEAGDTTEKPSARIKIIRQGETLRVVAVSESETGTQASEHGCSHQNQITGTYFPSGAAPAEAAAPPRSEFAAPTFDCTNPESATEEEVCADPELVANDRLLNRAWTELIARLDRQTAGFLQEDQRGYLRAQALHYPHYLHPYWAKASEDQHFLGNARNAVGALQRERIALLQGFETDRKGFHGLWVAHDATIEVSAGTNGTLSTTGGKWSEDGDYKAYCTYELIADARGRVTGSHLGGEAVDEGSTGLRLRLDRLTLVIEGKPAASEDPMCRRDVSPNARLFPVKPSPEINPKGLIR